MSDSHFNQAADRQARLERVLADYLHSVEKGEPLDRSVLITAHPELADDLQSFFRNHDSIGRLAVPLNAAAAEAPTITGMLDAEPAPVGMTVRYFGDYELLDEIARGGMGVVFKARQVNLNRVVALKMILAGQLANDSDVKRFYAEAEAEAKLVGPLERAWRWCRRNPALARLTAAVAFVLVAGTVISTFFAILAADRAGLATRETKRANDKATEVGREADRANENARQALANAAQARAKAEREAQARLREKAERQLRIATSERLAAQSLSVRRNFPQRSALLAIESAEATRQAGEPILPRTQEQLHESLEVLGGRPLSGTDASSVFGGGATCDLAIFHRPPLCLMHWLANQADCPVY